MAVTNQVPVKSHVANGLTTLFAFDFLLLDDADLVVEVDGTPRTLGTHYTVSGVGNPAGGDITMTSAPISGSSVVLYRVTALERSTDYQDNGDLLAETINDDFDRIWLAMQEMLAGTRNAPNVLRVGAGESVAPFAAVSTRAGRVAGFASETGDTELFLPGGPGSQGDAALVDFLPAGAGAVVRTVQAKLRDTIHVRDFGAVGDGSTDDTLALQNAINAAYGSTLVFDALTYKISSELTITDAIEIDGRGATINGAALPVGTGLNQIRAIHVYGTISGSTIPVTASLTPGGKTLTMDTSTLAVNDTILLSSDQLMVDGYGNAGSKRGQLSLIHSIDSGTQATMAMAAEFPFDHTQNLKVQRIVPCTNVTIRNLTIRMKGIVSVHGGIRLDYCTNFAIENVTVIGGEDHGIATWYSMHGVIDRCRIYDCTSAADWNPALQTGYAFVFYNASRDITLQNSYINNCRRGNTGGSTYPALYITVQNNYAVDGDNGFGTHEPCFNWSILNNYASGLRQNFIQIRGSRHLVQGNRVVGCGKQGIRVRTYYDDPTGLHDIHLIDNYLERCGETGIWIDGIDPVNDSPSNGGPVVGVVIRGGSIVDTNYNAIYVTRGTDVLIDGMLIDGTVTAGATDGNGVYINGGTDAWDRSTNVRILNCRFKRLLRNAVRADYATGITVRGCQIGQFAASSTGVNGVYINQCQDLTLADNAIDMTAGGYYGYWIDNCDHVMIDGGSVTVAGVIGSNDALLIDRSAGGAGGARSAHVTVRDLRVEGSNRYGIFARYIRDLVLDNVRIDDGGTLNIASCDDVTATNCWLTVTDGQIYGMRLSDCERAVVSTSQFKPGAAGQAGVYAFRTAGAGHLLNVNNCTFGAFIYQAIISSAMDYVLTSFNDCVDVVGATKIAVSGAVQETSFGNVPGGGMIKSIQRGIVAILGSNAAGTATVTAVNTSKAVLTHLGSSIFVGATDAADSDGRITLTNSTTITATRGNNASSSALNISYELVEYY